jgi:CO/xanthine dehydrogenase FAD-binding subunit
VRIPEAEALLEHVSIDRLMPGLIRAAATAGKAIDAIDDLHGSVEYKRHLVEVFVRRTVKEQAARAADAGSRS